METMGGRRWTVSVSPLFRKRLKSKVNNIRSGAFIPMVRKIFKRGDNKESEEASNDTEYAFTKSKGLLSRIKGSIFGSGGWATITFFVFAVLYVFQNEVSLRVAKTIQKRARKLMEKIESGQGDFEESDLKLLEGWRWRILLW